MRPASGRPSAGRIRRTPGRTLTLASRRSASLTSPRSGPGARTSGLRLGGYERANPSGVSAEYWSRRRDLNPRPADYEALSSSFQPSRSVSLWAHSITAITASDVVKRHRAKASHIGHGGTED